MWPDAKTDWAECARKQKLAWKTPVLAAPGFPQYGGDPFGMRLHKASIEDIVNLTIWLDDRLSRIEAMLEKL